MSDNTPTVPTGAQPEAAAAGHHHHHHHHGHHDHSHSHGDLAEANRKHYDENVEAFENHPHVKERAQRTALSIREIVPLSKESSSVLEFACGTGLVCREMLPYVKEIVGIDISSAVVEFCNKRFKEEGANEGCYAFTANIMTDKDVLSGRKFDLVYCASAYHHFEFPEEITRLLGEFLKPGGSLIIVDHFQKDDKTIDEKYRGHITRFGFVEEEIKALFTGAGLEFVSFGEIPRDEGDNDIFVAKGVKAI